MEDLYKAVLCLGRNKLQDTDGMEKSLKIRVLRETNTGDKGHIINMVTE